MAGGPMVPGETYVHVTLSAAKGLAGGRERCFATLSMTGTRYVSEERRVLQDSGTDASLRSA